MTVSPLLRERDCQATRVDARAIGNQEEDDADDEADDDAKAPLKWKDGLPTRKFKKDQTVVVTLETAFKAHGKTQGPELDANARQLLGLPAAK